ncbi:MAG: CdaR family protein [Sedimentibacter saalensis]|uniref:CdaR family protein n=1 Tax=Sedimentibacter saalensis TaxID=130788 RepID=UPI002B21FD41|nr:CdaR family protein [Sedimentibacter saalensis]MEA5096559.1 CdaR family protein [Sedimentibacter saalensis]
MKIKNDKLVIQVTCLIVSVILWIIIMVETSPLLNTTYTNIPVTIKNLSALENSNLVMMNTDKDNLTVSVKVEGYGEQLNNIKKGDFTAYIDVYGYGEGITNAKVEISGPSGVEIVNTYPSQIACNIERIISRVMDVTVQYEGNQADGYYKSLPLSNPSSVKITGPRSVVNSANHAIATVNIEGVKNDLVKTVPVRIYDGTDTEIFMSSPVGNVEVTVPVYPTKYVNLVPVVTGNPEAGYQLVDVTVNPGKVRIAARQDILDTIKELSLAELDISGAYNNILSSKDILNTDGLILMDLTTTPVVNAVIEEVVEKEFVYKTSDIQFVNLKEGSNATPANTDQDIIVKVVGTSSIVNSLKKSDLILSSDMTEAVAGNITVNVECVTDIKLNSISLSQNTVDVTVTAPVAATDAADEE